MRALFRPALYLTTVPFLMACGGSGSAVTARDASSQVGSSVTVCDVVADVRPDPISSAPLYLDLVHPAPSQTLTVVIQNRDGTGALRYLGHEICVSGIVEATGGDNARPRLTVKSPAQVRLAGPPPPEISAADAVAYSGKVATVCDVVAAFRPDTGSELVGYIDFVQSAPDAAVTVIVEDRRQLPEAPEYPGRVACVTGYLTSEKTMTLRDPREISLR